MTLFYEQFKRNAEELTVKVLRAKSTGEALGLISTEIKERKIQNVVSVSLTVLDVKEVEESVLVGGVNFSSQLSRDEIERAGMGISEFDLGVAELGSLFQDASGLHTRLVSMLPPVHLALLRTSALVETFADALEVIEKKYNGCMPPYLSFVTGPSKTADIERELTIGVHGPETLIILCID
ncbi:MAG: lactate utilization protein [bacterium]|nr:lactate utilization protein [bacterium]